MEPWVIWKVKDEEYKLKLTTSTIVSLENKYKCNLLTLIDGTPSLSVMLDITHKAMNKYHHGIKDKDIIDIYDDYLEQGGSQVSFMTNVFVPIYKVSGFFPKSVAENMDEKMIEATEQLENM
ncbi:MAG: DUF6096 family protein [Lachnospiraceae bacterium]